MPMRRTPLKRAQHSLISDRALDCFRELQEYDAAEDRESHERWWYLHSRLCDEVSDKRLWEWPSVIRTVQVLAMKQRQHGGSSLPRRLQLATEQR
jgi:hypothetical protein